MLQFLTESSVMKWKETDPNCRLGISTEGFIIADLVVYLYVINLKVV